MTPLPNQPYGQTGLSGQWRPPIRGLYSVFDDSTKHRWSIYRFGATSAIIGSTTQTAYMTPRTQFSHLFPG
jgi:hypothetical protein